MFWRTQVWGTLWPPLRLPSVGDMKKEREALFSACPRGKKALSGSPLTNQTGGNPKMRSSIQWIMPLCVTTTPLRLVTFPSETKQPRAWGSHNQAGLVKRSPRAEGAGPWLGWFQDGGTQALGHQDWVVWGWKQAAGAFSFYIRHSLGQAQISLYTILECTQVAIKQIRRIPSLDLLLTAISPISKKVKSSLLRVNQHNLKGKKRNFSLGGVHSLWEPSA